MKTILIDKELSDWAIEIRRHLHQYPELSGQEYKTAAYIREHLETCNIDILESYESPNVIGYIKGTQGKKTIALRADIDALPIQEEGTKPVISKHDGIAHVCGHDGHTAILLAVAKWMALNRSSIKPNVKFIFQSSEEMTPSGAEKLIREGVLEDVDVIFGIHLWQGLEKEKIGITHGPMMASADDFEIEIFGSGGHGSMPDETIDPIYIATHVIQALQSIVSRSIKPIEPAVISVGKIHSGTSYNIIPSSAKLVGTVRAMTPEMVEFLKMKMSQLTSGICASFGATAEFNYIKGTPPLINDANESKIVEEVLRNSFGDECITVIQPVMGGEDFSHYLEVKPGVFMFVGMNGEVSKYPHHHPMFDIDEEVFPRAIELFIHLVLDYQ